MTSALCSVFSLYFSLLATMLVDGETVGRDVCVDRSASMLILYQFCDAVSVSPMDVPLSVLPILLSCVCTPVFCSVFGLFVSIPCPISGV